MIAGIDFGSRYSGNTVVAVLDSAARPVLFCSGRKQDADRFLMDILGPYEEGLIAIDAPLSLPGVYCNLPGCDDYFYRQCDRELGAMSPMFLGGLTARAMRKKAHLEHNAMPFFEVYPAAAARLLQLEQCGYKQDRDSIGLCIEKLNVLEVFRVEVDAVPTWHHLDALLALWVGVKIKSGTAGKAGNPEEGLIYF